jgi:uncharacterized protein (DUF302 family)
MFLIFVKLRQFESRQNEMSVGLGESSLPAGLPIKALKRRFMTLIGRIKMKMLRRIVAIIALGILWISAVAPASAAGPRDMFLESESPLKLSETVDAIKAEAGALGWSTLAAHDLAGIAAKKLFVISPIMVLETCNAKYSVELINKDETRYVSSLLPCRVAIYETSTGKVIISRLNTTAFGSMMEPAVADLLKKAGAEMEGIIEKVRAKR